MLAASEGQNPAPPRRNQRSEDMSDIDKEKFDLSLDPKDLAPTPPDEECMRAIEGAGKHLETQPGDHDGRMRRMVAYSTMTTKDLRARLMAMDEQAIAICELFAKYDMVCGGASILPNLEMLLMDFRRTWRKGAAMERALTELVGIVETNHRDDPATISALQEARTVLQKKDWR